MKKDFGSKTWIFPMPVLMIGTYDEKVAAAFLGERVTMMSAVGGCLIIGGVVITNLRRAK